MCGSYHLSTHLKTKVWIRKQAVRKAALYAPTPVHGVAQLQPIHALLPVAVGAMSIHDVCVRHRQRSDSIIA